LFIHGYLDKQVPSSSSDLIDSKVKQVEEEFKVFLPIADDQVDLSFFNYIIVLRLLDEDYLVHTLFFFEPSDFLLQVIHLALVSDHQKSFLQVHVTLLDCQSDYCQREFKLAAKEALEVLNGFIHHHLVLLGVLFIHYVVSYFFGGLQGDEEVGYLVWHD
jgi:hypothetical protein